NHINQHLRGSQPTFVCAYARLNQPVSVQDDTIFPTVRDLGTSSPTVTYYLSILTSVIQLSNSFPLTIYTRVCSIVRHLAGRLTVPPSRFFYRRSNQRFQFFFAGRRNVFPLRSCAFLRSRKA